VAEKLNTLMTTYLESNKMKIGMNEMMVNDSEMSMS